MSRKKKWVLAGTGIGLSALIAVAATLFFIFFERVKVPSNSMAPTMRQGEAVWVQKLSYVFRDPRRGEIVVLRFPLDDPASNRYLIKRVVATGGEEVELRNGYLFVNGERFAEEYVAKDSCDYGPVRVPKGMLFCLGDNRSNSRDSRLWGMVPTDAVTGKVIFK